jgi:hypothetical protein
MTEKGLSDGDRNRIAEYLEKPAHERTVDDLVPPDRDDASDAADAIETGDLTDVTDTGDAADAADVTGDDAN